MVRLASELWVKAYLRQCGIDGLPAVVARRGDGQAGAIFLRIDSLDGRIRLLGPAPGAASDDDGTRRWSELSPAEGMTHQEASERLQRTMSFDPDIWIVDIDSRDGSFPACGLIVAD